MNIFLSLLLAAASPLIVPAKTHLIPTLQPRYTYYADADGDGYGNPDRTVQAYDVPAGYTTNGEDCDDASAGTHPGAPERCNGLDDDCDGVVDEAAQTTYFADADGDGFGDAANGRWACAAPSGYVDNIDDCNDADAAVHPGATEVADGLDDDCDGTIDETTTAPPLATRHRDGRTDASAGIAVYPNPATTTVGIELDPQWSEVIAVRVYDETGSRLAEANTLVDYGTVRFTVDTWPCGLYLVEISAGTQRFVRQFTILRR